MTVRRLAPFPFPVAVTLSTAALAGMYAVGLVCLECEPGFFPRGGVCVPAP